MPRPILPSAIATFSLAVAGFAHADELAPPKGKQKGKAEQKPTAESAEKAAKNFAVAPGLQVEAWAAEPLLANPVALSFGHDGRAFVAETYRRRTSVPDIRKNEAWTMENLALRSVEERVAFLKAKHPESAKKKPGEDAPDLNGDGQFDWRDWEVESERVKLVFDSDGDGKADQSRVFADGFKSLTTGVGAGIAAHQGDVFYTCTPDLWRIRADGTKEKLLTGFGVHVVYSGHDMHGAKIGPDGRLYWTIADCGARVISKEGATFDLPDTGAVFRCNPDGSGFEIFAKGLRNPQSLAFNELGDLFTGDNNADGGDEARWLHLVEGADYGWTIGWQFLSKLGAWNTEQKWHLRNPADSEKNLTILPPVELIGHGPAGIAYYPGTGLPDAYRDHFFMADFPGGIRSFRLTPKGATYSIENPKGILRDNSPGNMSSKVLWNLFPSDVAFAPGSGLYVLDWVQGWEKTGQGRVFRVFDPALDANPLVQETKRLLGEGFAKRSEAELTKLLGHADQRVRLGAQFELVRRDKPGPLASATQSANPRLMRIHGIWGLAQLARAKPDAAARLSALAKDGDAEIRAQWAKLVGEAKLQSAGEALLPLITDAEPRVRFFAAQAAGKLALTSAQMALVKIAAEPLDPHLRHAVAQALARVAKPGSLDQPANATELLALRQAAPEKLAGLLANPKFQTAVASAIHDDPIPAAWPALAELATTSALPSPIARRAINANYLLGNATAASRLERVASDTAIATEPRLFAIESLALCNRPFERDRITGLWRKLPSRTEAAGTKEVAARMIPALLNDRDESIRLAVIDLAGSLRIDSASDALAKLVASNKVATSKTRVAALQALAAMDSPKLSGAVQAALAATDPRLLEAARRLAAKASPADAVKINAAILGHGNIPEQQAALATIAQQPGTEVDRIIAQQFELLAAGKLPKALWLDLIEAAEKRADPEIKAKLASFASSPSSTDSIAAWRECLEGGDAKLGREIFYEKAEAACLRCHKVKGEGGDVGPDMAGLATKYDREYLLRSIVDPNAAIAPGYENLMLTLTDGNLVAGILSAEDSSHVTIKSLADGSTQKVAKSSIKERMAVPSAMPPGLGHVLGKRALRDVVEFLATLK
jgi:quinoprotein glucose dehydrogenase